MRILDLTFTHVGHPLHRGRMTDVESHKGATLASRLTIRFLVVTEERAKRICQQPGLSQLFDVIAGSHSPAFGPSDIFLRRLHQQGKYKGITLTPPEQQCGSINAAVWGAVLRVSPGAIRDTVGPQFRVRHTYTRNARASTSPRSIGFCVIWDCISSSSCSACLSICRRT